MSKHRLRPARRRASLFVVLTILLGVFMTSSASAACPVIVTVGTSIEAGRPQDVGPPWPQIAAQRLGCPIIDRSLGGGAYTAANANGETIGSRINAAVAELHPDILILGGPVNDLVRLDVSQIGDLNLAVYNAVNAAKAAGVSKVLVGGIYPFNDGVGYAFQAGWWQSLEARRVAYNQWAYAMYGVNHFDLTWVLKETTTLRGDKRWFSDGLHPNELGNRLMGFGFDINKLVLP